MLPSIPPRLINPATVSSLNGIIASTASNMPTKPSPAISPELYKIPFSITDLRSLSGLFFFLFSKNQRITPPINIGDERCIGR